MLLGHKGRCFDVRVSCDGVTALSASEDGTARVWRLVGRQCLSTLTHNKDAEVLRAMFLPGATSSCLVTCGSDGKAFVWEGSPGVGDTPSYSKSATLQHASEQIYVCEHTQQGELLTAADDQLQLWDVKHSSAPLLSHTFVSLARDTTTVFGGNRNPDMQAFVFDCKFRHSGSGISDDLLAAALSDGTLRLADLRDPAIEKMVLQPTDLRGAKDSAPHVTAVAWTSSGDTLLACLGSGDISAIDIRTGRTVTQLEGHESTCFGCIATGSSILSWSGDGSILEWDAVNMRCGVVDTPLGRRQLPDFPVYSCATTKDGRYLLCAGGTSSGKAFMGVPVNVIDLAA